MPQPTLTSHSTIGMLKDYATHYFYNDITLIDFFKTLEFEVDEVEV